MKKWLAAAILAIAGCGVVWGAPLVDAAAANDEAAVRAALQEGANVNDRSWDGSTALMWAVVNQNVPLVRELIAAGADVGLSNNYGSFALREAVDRGNDEIVALLLEAGADVESRTSETGPTMLARAAVYGHGRVAELLLEHGANPNVMVNAGNTPFPVLVWAVTHKSADVARALIEFGADVHWSSTPIGQANIDNATRPITLAPVSAEPRIGYGGIEARAGYTVAMYAAREGCAACIMDLAAAGVDLDQGDPNGVTPLILAATNLQFDTVIALIESGADPNLWDWWGRAPLYSVVDVATPPLGGYATRANLVDEAGPLDAVLALLEAGADPNFQLKRRVPFRAVGADRGCDQLLVQGATPLLRAAKTHEVEIAQALIDFGAIVDLPQLVGITPLMAAAGGGSWDCDPRGGGQGTGFLLTGGGFAMEQRAIATIDVLLAAGADINHQMFGPHGDFPEYRIRFETDGFYRWEMRELRADAEANAENFVTRNGQTALHWAAFWAWDFVTEHLVRSGASPFIRDVRGMTPIDAALGLAGGNSFGGATITINTGTAELIERLIDELGLNPGEPVAALN